MGPRHPIRDWRDWPLLRFLEACAAALLFREQVGAVTVFLDGTEIPCLLDGLVTTAAGCWLVLLDGPGLSGHEMEVLKTMVSSRAGVPVLRVTDADLTAFLETERPPLAA